MRRFVLSILFILAAVYLSAWTLEDCVEVNFDHPDCDRYVTTTTFTDQITTTTIGETTTTEVPPSTTSSTQPDSTTSTTGSEASTTTSIPSEQPTTTVTSDTPTTATTTIQECAPGLIHQPPLCLEATTTTVTDQTTITTIRELPFTGAADLGLLALAGVSLLFLGFTALRYGRRPE